MNSILFDTDLVNLQLCSMWGVCFVSRRVAGKLQCACDGLFSMKVSQRDLLWFGQVVAQLYVHKFIVSCDHFVAFDYERMCCSVIHMHAYTHACTHAHTHACTHTHACAHTRAHTNMHTCTHAHTRTHARTHACMHTNTHTRARTHTHTHTHTHKYSQIHYTQFTNPSFS